MREVNLSLFPVLVVALGGDVPERTLLRIARNAKNAIEQVPGVLSAELRGARDEVVEIIAEPMLLKSYGVSLEDLVARSRAGNSLVAAGALESASGRFAVKVPALIETAAGHLKVPGRRHGLGRGHARRRRRGAPDLQGRDLDHPRQRQAGHRHRGLEAHRRQPDRDGGRREGGRIGAARRPGPATVEVAFTQDKSKTIRSMLHELQNSVITAVLLVIVIMLLVLGGRASLFIGIAIPASFLSGILGLQLAGLTVNIVVLFSLILAVGMLVDDAIIVSEFAERRMAEGMDPKAAYSLAAKRMAGPVIAATLTRVAAFSPLMFWPGIVGQFMKYLPLTLIATLSASLVVALFFTPTLGALLGRHPPPPHDERAAERGLYMRTVRLAVHHPLATLRADGRAAGRRRAGLRPASATASSSSRTSSPITASSRCGRAATSRSPRRTASCARSRSGCSA